MTAKAKTVHLYPVPGVSAYPWPAAECDVPEDVAAELLAYIPPPFTTEPPKATGGPVSAGSVFLVGESGPEVILAPSPSETAPDAAEG